MGDIVLAVRDYLASQSTVTALLGSDAKFGPWVFQDSLYWELNSQTCAIVVTDNGSWTSPNDHNTARFPMVLLTFCADPQRDANQNITHDDTGAKIRALHEAVFKVLHWTDANERQLGTLRVLRSSCLNEPQIRPYVDGDHAASAQITYAIGM